MQTWKTAAVALVVGAALAATTAVGTAQSAGKQPSQGVALTAMDYIEIQQLIARYAFALDTAADNGQAYAKLFTPDGVFRAKLAAPFEAKGSTQLAAFAMGDLAHRGPSFVHDFATNILIKPSPQGATGRIYMEWIQVPEGGNPGVVQTGGHYDDVYVKTAQGWRIKTRTFSPAKLGPETLSQLRQ